MRLMDRMQPPLPRGLEQLASIEGDWRTIAEHLWRARLGWPQTVRRLALPIRERTVRRGAAVDTARIDLVLLALEQFDRQAVRQQTAYAQSLAGVFEAAGDSAWLTLARLHVARDLLMADDAAAEPAMRAWIDGCGQTAALQDQAWAQSTLGGLLVRKGQEEDGFRLRYGSIETLRRAEPAPELVFALMNLGVTHLRFGNLRSADALLSEAWAAAQQLAMQERYYLVASNVASAAIELGAPQRALDTLTPLIDLSDAGNDRLHYQLMMADALRALGRLDESRSWLDAVIATIDTAAPGQLLPQTRLSNLALLRAEGRLDEALAELRRAEADPPAFLTHTHALHLFSEAASLFADREEWDAAYEYERRHRDRYVALQKVAANAERLSLQARYELYRNQVERDFERRKREAAESAHATVQALNHSLSQRLDEIQALQAALQEQVITDPLTGLYNRRFLAEVLPREIERASREGHPVAVALIDLDTFKRVNDLHGHAVGDEVLRRLAMLLRENTRGTDYCCRFGGEEFCVLLTGLDAEAAAVRIRDILEAFSELSFEAAGGEQILGLSYSAGIAAYPAHSADAETVLALADAALLRAKRAGKRRVYQSEPSLDRPGESA